MRSTWFALAVTLAVQMLVSMAAVTVPVLAPAAAPEIGVSVGYVGLFVALSYGGSMAASITSGDLIKRFGAIRVSQCCLLLCALGLAMTAGGSIALLVPGALVIGAGYGAVTPASSHILAKSTPVRMMSLVFSLKQTGVPIGGALAGAVVPSLVLWRGWRFGALFVGACCLAAAVLAQAIRRGFDADRDPHRGIGIAGLVGPLRLASGEPGPRRLSITSFCFAAVQLCLVTYLVTYLSQQQGYTLVEAGLMLSVAQGAGIVARIAWGALADRGGRPLMVLGGIGIAMALSAVAFGAIGPTWPRVLVALVCAAFGATAIGWNGVFLAEVAREAPVGRAGEATGGTLFFTYFGVLVGPPLFALMVENGVSYAAAYVLIVMPALACGAWLLL